MPIFHAFLPRDAHYQPFLIPECALYGTKTAGELAQLVERVLSMHEVSGSIPEFSTWMNMVQFIMYVECFVLGLRAAGPPHSRRTSFLRVRFLF